MKHGIVFVLLLLSCFIAPAQTLTYEVILYGKTIGTTTVQKTTTNNGDVQYLLKSSSVAKVLFMTRRTAQNYLVTYRKGIMESVDATNNVDGEVTTIKITRDDKRYSIIRNGLTSYLNEWVKASTLTLYFTEPLPQQRVFAERLGEFYTVNKTAEGKYEYTPSDNLRTTLHYSNGRLSVMEMRKSFITVYLRLLRVE